ncbi:ATP-binding protein [Streptomyces lusitanus]|uniref:ATP-binding protein n=1 Tax=Streptomyces lusitanus TaxID=68232 RepID=A0ABU3K2I5_9ACTN|nr:ATP-binding protein [Streptomyces lusitanus]
MMTTRNSSPSDWPTAATDRFVTVTTARADIATVRGLRRRLMKTRRDWEDADTADIAELLAAELLTNAAWHAHRPAGEGARITLVAYRSKGQLRVEAADPDPNPPVVRHATAEEESGRRLALVDALADHWGVSERTDGKAVWFSLDPATAGATV